MWRVPRLLMALAALALAVGVGSQSAHAAPLINDAGHAKRAVTLLTHSPLDCDHGDDRADRSTDGIATCKAISAPMHLVPSSAAADVPVMPRTGIARPVAAAFLDGLTSTPDPLPPRLPAID
jgi:hypothetical protein